MLRSMPPTASSAVITNDCSSDGNRATTALATTHGEGSMNGGTRKIHRMSCHKSRSEANTASVLATVTTRLLTVATPSATPAKHAPPFVRTQASLVALPCAETASPLVTSRGYVQDSAPVQ